MFLQENLGPERMLRVSLHSRLLDTGAMQIDPIRVNARASLEGYLEKIHGRREELVEVEV